MLGGPPAAAAAEAVPGSGFTRAELGPGVTAGIELEAALPALVDCIHQEPGWLECVNSDGNNNNNNTKIVIIIIVVILIIKVLLVLSGS